MTYLCSECDVYWYPYQTQGGACPECGGGTVRRGAPASEDAAERYKVAFAARAARERRAALARDFEAFYAEREVRLNGLDELPVAEPERPFQRTEPIDALEVWAQLDGGDVAA